MARTERQADSVEIFCRYFKGEKLKEIAKEFRLSYQRTRQMKNQGGRILLAINRSKLQAP